MKRYLILEDGTKFAGEAFGAPKSASGEVVFTTGMTGFQEAVTDESYANQILVFTNPLIGNYGVTLDDYESLQPHCKGVVCREVARVSNNWREQETFPDFLKHMGIPGIKGVDTRAITKKLRVHGTMKGCLVDSLDNFDEVLAKLKATLLEKDLVKQVTTASPYPNPGSKRNIVLVDFGVKHSILRALAARNCNTIVMPASVSAEKILELHPDGVLLSNGPGDPKDVPGAIEMCKKIEKELPLFGICLGHQIFCLANGADTYHMKFGHRGFNHPVREIATGRIAFTSQNHGYAVDPDSLKGTDLIVTHKEINDGTIEGVRHKFYPAFSVQFHPDAAPGPHDAIDLFDDFMDAIDKRKEEKQNA